MTCRVYGWKPCLCLICSSSPVQKFIVLQAESLYENNKNIFPRNWWAHERYSPGQNWVKYNLFKGSPVYLWDFFFSPWVLMNGPRCSLCRSVSFPLLVLEKKPRSWGTGWVRSHVVGITQCDSGHQAGEIPKLSFQGEGDAGLTPVFFGGCKRICLLTWSTSLCIQWDSPSLHWKAQTSSIVSAPCGWASVTGCWYSHSKSSSLSLAHTDHNSLSVDT